MEEWPLIIACIVAICALLAFNFLFGAVDAVPRERPPSRRHAPMAPIPHHQGRTQGTPPLRTGRNRRR